MDACTKGCWAFLGQRLPREWPRGDAGPPPEGPPTERVAEVLMPSTRGPLRLVAYRSRVGDILAAVSGVGAGHRVPVRVHDACLTGEVFGSVKCDCADQLDAALSVQRADGFGAVIYMPQEGRGIGLANKIAAYHLQETQGLDTVDANLALGLPAEARDYAPVATVLRDIGIESVILMTNNPAKVRMLQEVGVSVEATVPVVTKPRSAHAKHYLDVKRARMGHMLPLPEGVPAPRGGPRQPSSPLPELGTTAVPPEDLQHMEAKRLPWWCVFCSSQGESDAAQGGKLPMRPAA